MVHGPDPESDEDAGDAADYYDEDVEGVLGGGAGAFEERWGVHLWDEGDLYGLC